MNSLSIAHKFILTVFIRIVAVATINFSLTGVRLLIEGGSYSRAALLILERHLLVTLTL